MLYKNEDEFLLNKNNFLNIIVSMYIYTKVLRYF